MELLLDVEGKVNYGSITRNSTVQDLLDAIDIFLKDNPLSCDKCKESCCKKSWQVEVDNVCVNRLCKWDNEAAGKFVRDNLIIKENFFREFDQYVFKKKTSCAFITETNLCTIYEQRPIICRLYICTPKSYRYNVIRELIGATYLEALVLEEEIRNSDFKRSKLNLHISNPAVFAKDYNILLDDILNYARNEEWLYPDDLEGLYKIL